MSQFVSPHPGISEAELQRALARGRLLRGQAIRRAFASPLRALSRLLMQRTLRRQGWITWPGEASTC
jgi:hypothetical protein